MTTIVFSLFKAQARFNESSQKLDLLKYSLEQRLNELPKNHPKSTIIIEELSLVASPTLSPRQSMISTQNQYSTLSKPAALTGMWHVAPDYFGCFFGYICSWFDKWIKTAQIFEMLWQDTHNIKLIILTILKYTIQRH